MPCGNKVYFIKMCQCSLVCSFLKNHFALSKSKLCDGEKQAFEALILKVFDTPMVLRSLARRAIFPVATCELPFFASHACPRLSWIRS